MTLEEYKEWAALPLGRHIQWANILLQLAMPSVDSKKPETTLTFFQCIYQAGPSSTEGVLREAHDFFNHDANINHLIEELAKALQRIKGNWESAQALLTFSAIAGLALSLSKSDAARSACLAFLSTLAPLQYAGFAICERKRTQRQTLMTGPSLLPRASKCHWSAHQHTTWRSIFFEVC